MDFAAGEKHSWLAGLGVQWFPLVGWAERGGGPADGHGNSVPRFHVTWGTGPAVMAPIPGLYAAGEVAGFGGGGVHGYRSLEGTFLGGCLFSGRQAGRTAAAAL